VESVKRYSQPRNGPLSKRRIAHPDGDSISDDNDIVISYDIF